MSDPMMADITAAVSDKEGGRDRLAALWEHIGDDGDPLHRVTLAHYLADLQDSPEDALDWDKRALTAAGELTDARAQAYHPSLTVRGFLPSLHLNLADCYRRVGDFDSARAHLASAHAVVDVLGDDAYGAVVRDGLVNVEQALAANSIERLPTN
ncbi:hypothetical protein [Antrihabitans cavernicola]|uniref:Tetratricopeptide repeat protein n=1 Tax=Antrihabitans cavernicola TaxID=2495913 RepID=A0A5A7S900_9NOCA|nr:hypothetical protein [Spelaeibacter cavernicola]KAA0022610.1 hypothetical protein FOY51_13040 [Spelaeibacter cavernicola]